MDAARLLPGCMVLVAKLYRAHPSLLAHSLDVAQLVGRMYSLVPQGAGLSESDLRAAAFLHGIGKTEWPRELFSKRPLGPGTGILCGRTIWRGKRDSKKSGRTARRECWPRCASTTPSRAGKATRRKNQPRPRSS